jgi:hypothetical protein
VGITSGGSAAGVEWRWAGWPGRTGKTSSNGIERAGAVEGDEASQSRPNDERRAAEGGEEGEAETAVGGRQRRQRRERREEEAGEDEGEKESDPERIGKDEY